MRAAALLLVLACAPAWAAPAAAAERDYATIVALGATVPLASEEAPYTPIAVVDHESDGYYGAGALSAQLRTSRLDVAMRHPVLPALALGYSAGLQVVSEGDGPDLYDAGTRQREQTFTGDSAGLTLSATAFPDGPWQAGWEGERARTRYAATHDTAPAFVLPANFTRVEQRVILRRRGLLGEEDAKVELSLTRGRREGWRAWSLDADPDAHARYRREELRWSQPLAWSGRHRTDLALAALDGARLDVLSGYRVGGFAGREVVAGYYRNEFRARRAVVLNGSHEVRFAEDRRLSLGLDAARLEELPLPYRTEAAGPRAIAGAWVGLRYGIRGLGGLPLIVRYGEGLRVPNGSPEGHRREVLLLVAAGF